MKYTYLLINLCSLLVPFILSFESRIAYYKKWKYLFPAMTATAIFFIAWDSIFTANGVWGFNPDYITGIYIINLPIEEVLFFFCIPYSSIFAYEALNLIRYDEKGPVYRIFTRFCLSILIVICIGGIVFFYDRAYTFYTCLFLSLLLLLHLFVLKSDYIGRFFLAYLVILIPFTIVNGLLTGSWIAEPVVWYNDDENIGMRLLTIPAEDVLYGMLMLGMSVSMYEGLKKRY